jgi:ubiquinone biosynthesis protein Coq4
MVEVSKADYEYFNGAVRRFTTESSVLVSSSKYLNHAPLRALIAQEFLRRNGPDMPNTAYIPEVAQILHDLEDMGEIMRLFEVEKQRLPEFRTWLDRRLLSDFKAEDVAHCKPGTLGFTIHDFIVNSGYNMDVFFQGMKVESDYTFYLKERALTHDIEHMVTGFGTNNGGEIALLAANTRALHLYFCPELAAYFNRVGAYLKAKSILKSSLHHPRAIPVQLDAEDRGAAQGRSWKLPLMLVPWRDLIDVSIEEIREEYGIVDAPPPGYWAESNELSEDPRYPVDVAPQSVAAE